MDTTRVFVWHDPSGNITAVGRPAQSHADNVTPVAIHDGHGAVSIDIPAHLAVSLHRTHRIDMETRELVKRRSS